jgi:site-specific DNA recombinase
MYADGAQSASLPIEARPGSRQLMADAMRGRFQVLIIEALDRFSRDSLDQEKMIRRLEHRGVRIIGYTDGYDSVLEGREFMRQVRGSFNEQQLRDIAKKTHRGLTGQVARGYTAGGVSYGYRSVVAGVDAKGEAIGHLFEIDEAAARWVRWIFEKYADGWSTRKLAYELNRLQVPAPRGGTWSSSAIYGSPAKGSGIINNELYTGRYIWNRSRWVRDPEDKRKRERFDRPRSEWLIEDRPAIRILTDELWQAARIRMATPRSAGGSKGKGAKARTLFGGLLTCGLCGGPMIAENALRYGCVARKDRGKTVCKGTSVAREKADKRLLGHARDKVLSDESIRMMEAAVREIHAARRREGALAVDAGGRRLAELEREIGNLVNAIASIGLSEALQARLQAAEAEQGRLMTEGALKRRTDRQDAIPDLVKRYKVKAMAMRAALEADVDQARKALRQCLGQIRVTREPGGTFADLVAGPERLLIAAGGSLEVVAGAGFEPTTFGL